MQKTIIMTGMVVGSYVGGSIPLLWGDGVFSFTSILLSALGGFVGIYYGYKLSQKV